MDLIISCRFMISLELVFAVYRSITKLISLQDFKKLNALYL